MAAVNRVVSRVLSKVAVQGISGDRGPLHTAKRLVKA